MDENALTTAEQGLARDLGSRFCKMVERSVGVMETIGRTNELPRKTVEVVNGKGEVVDSRVELVRPPGMSDAEFHLHQDAMLPSKSAPFYLVADRNRVELAQRIAGDRSNAPAEIARLVVKKLETPKREYPVIDVTATEVK